VRGRGRWRCAKTAGMTVQHQQHNSCLLSAPCPAHHHSHQHPRRGTQHRNTKSSTQGSGCTANRLSTPTAMSKMCQHTHPRPSTAGAPDAQPATHGNDPAPTPTTRAPWLTYTTHGGGWEGWATLGSCGPRSHGNTVAPATPPLFGRMMGAFTTQSPQHQGDDECRGPRGTVPPPRPTVPS
jgi:hypothetical protein